MVRGAARGDRRRCSARSGRRSHGRSASLGDPDEAAAAHEAAGLQVVSAIRLRERRSAPDAAAYWQELAKENGHFRRVAATLSDTEAAALAGEIDARLAPYREGDHLSLPRTLVLVTARR